MSGVVSLLLLAFSRRDDIAKLLKIIGPAIPLIIDLFSKVDLSQLQAQRPAQEFDVSWLQRSLNQLVPGARLEVDGTYGEKTRIVVAEFQRRQGLEDDGWAGVETQAAIVAALR